MSEETLRPASETENLQRLAARGSVLAGGAFWMVAAFAGPFAYGGVGLAASLRAAMWPLLAAGVIFVVGLFYEQLAAVLLFGAAAATLVWGVLYGWEAGAWVLMALLLIAPTSSAGVLFLLCARAESIRSLESRGR